MVRVGTDHGVPARRLLAATGLRVADLDTDDHEVEATQELAVARNLIQAVGDQPSLGTEVAAHFSLNSCGLLGFAMLSSPTAGEALRVALRAMQVGNQFVDTTFSLGRTTGRVEFHGDSLPADVRSFLLERDIAVIFGVIVLRCLSTQILARLDETRLELTLPGDRVAAMVDGMTGLLSDMSPNPMPQFPVVANRSANVLTFPLDFLAEPMSMPNPATAALCEQHCLDVLQQRRERGRLAAQIRATLLNRAAAAPTAAEVAADLSIDRRTLHRHLANEGTTFRALQEEVRCTLAIDMLTVLGFTAQETARRLGYTSPAAFTRAFTRWTGQPPSNYRNLGDQRKPGNDAAGQQGGRVAAEPPAELPHPVLAF